MKRSVSVLMTLVMILTIILSPTKGYNEGNGSCDNYHSRGLYLFEHENYRGRFIIIRPFYFEPWLGDRDFNDIASSACVVGSYDWWVCEHANYWGYCSRIEENTPYLGGNIAVGNDRASSVGMIIGSTIPRPQ